MFLYFYKNFFHNKNRKNEKNIPFESSSSSLFKPDLRVFLKAFFRVLGCNPRKRGGFIGLKVETPQNGVVLVAGSLKRRRFGGVVFF